jgi:hypothetical protein
VSFFTVYLSPPAGGGIQTLNLRIIISEMIFNLTRTIFVNLISAS